ncbi:nitrogen fixation protein FixH [Granulicella aggregans]|uniref:Nitrogen fixation protein FixH n=1 Tax=Granulicella aggregans TaxID=474949 RepID=A0A7W7ZBW7_9BACT|nr:nitrogen fixation protein FixH [Granulicella aggregans]
MLIVQEMEDGRWMATVQYQKAKIRIYRDTRELAERCALPFLPTASPVGTTDRRP